MIDIARHVTTAVDLSTRRAVAFTLNNIAVNPQNHAACERLGLARSLLPLLADPDKDTNLQALLATRHLCESAKFRNQFVEINGKYLININIYIMF